jgi:hypothetical protein
MCKQEPMKEYIRKAIKIILHTANQSSIPFDFKGLQKLGDVEAAAMIEDKIEGNKPRWQVEKHNFHEMERMSRYRTGIYLGDTITDYRWNEIVSHYFKPFSQCTFRIKVEERESKILFYESNHENAWYYSYGLQNRSEPGLKKKILNLYLPILNRCPSLVIASVGIETKSGGGHRNYIVIETEVDKNKVNRFNFYVYEPHGKLREVTSKAADLIGYVITEWANKKHPDRKYEYRVYDTLLCPVGLQSNAGRGMGYCTVFSIISAVTVILIWAEMFKAKKVLPLWSWGNCIEKLYVDNFSSEQLSLLAVAFASATTKMVATKTINSSSPLPPSYTGSDLTSLRYVPKHSKKEQVDFTSAYKKFLKYHGSEKTKLVRKPSITRSIRHASSRV